MHATTRWGLLLAALAMVVVSWLAQSGALGGDVGDESNRFPTLLVPAGYAFGIWGLIFLLDLVFAAWQVQAAHAGDAALVRLRPWALAGFGLTALWTPVFLQQSYLAAVLVIWAAWATVLAAAVLAARAGTGSAASRPVACIALALHAGWLSLAAVVNTAQLMLALGLTTATGQWPASAGLWLAAAVLFVAAQRAQRPSVAALLAYIAAAAWGLVAVVVGQQAGSLPGARASAGVAAALLALLVLHGAWLAWGRWRRTTAAPEPSTAHPGRIRRG